MVRRRRARAAALLGAVLVAGLAVAILHRPAGRPAPRPPATLADLWAGRGRLSLVHKWTGTQLGGPAHGAASGAQIAIVGRTWYLFNRLQEPGDCPSRPGMTYAGTQVRASTDAGATWSRPVPIVTPQAGTPWACAGADGTAFYDAARGVWGFLFQCLGSSGGWQGCYAERRSRSPLGRFSPAASVPDPVIAPGQLWGRICADPSHQCWRPPGQAQIADEGTFDVVPAAGGGWWVGFHGSDGVHGYRGIARTSTFRSDGWLVAGAGGTPPDAVLGPADAAGWREQWAPGGPVGFGAGRILREGGFYYQLAEAADLSLACTAGQNWDLGLFRTRSPAATHWEQYPAGNPIVYSSRAPGAGGCNVLYPQIFRDPVSGATYLMYGRGSPDPGYDGIYLYLVQHDSDLLTDGDITGPDAAAWPPLPGTSTQRTVERLPDGSPDGTQYLAIDCGAATCSGDAVYQDAPAARAAGCTVTFGGTFRTDAGSGPLDVVLDQIDAAGKVLAQSVAHAQLGPRYAWLRGTVRLAASVQTVRFEIRPGAPVTYRADNLHVDPQAGCRVAH